MALSKILPASRDQSVDAANLVLNGSMAIAQRGTSSTSTGYLLDRWTTSFSGVSVTTTQDTDVPSGYGFSNSIKYLNTSTSTATNAYFAPQQIIEAQNIRNSGWDYTSSSSYITLSFWAKSSIAGTYMCSIRTEDGTAYNISSQYTLAANTWKNIQVSFSGDSNLTFDNNNGAGLIVFPVLELGTDYTSGSSFDVWTAHSGSTQSPDADINFMDTASATFHITGVCLNVGDQAPANYPHRSYGDELRRCQRYYELIGYALGRAVNSSQAEVNSAFKVDKRAAPTITLKNGTSAIAEFLRGAANVTSIDSTYNSQITHCGNRVTSSDTGMNNAELVSIIKPDTFAVDAEL